MLRTGVTRATTVHRAVQPNLVLQLQDALRGHEAFATLRSGLMSVVTTASATGSVPALLFGLQPVVNIVSVFAAALLVEFEGATGDVVLGRRHVC